MVMLADEIYALAQRLFPICRSITGNGVRDTLAILASVHPIKVHEVPSGTKAFDWIVPKEWNLRDAFVKDESGRKIVDFHEHNLHVMGYSTPVDVELTLEQLKAHLHSDPLKPNAIPYVTSYYKEDWGFCIQDEKKARLKEGRYRAHIDSTLENGFLTYGEILLPGSTTEEILLSTYICHPSMANDDLSGPCILIHLAKEIASWEKRRYTYRIVFVPETIGSIVYLNRNLDHMRKNTLAGFVLTCLGDNRTYSYLASRYGNTLADKVAQNILKFHHPDYKRYSFLYRGSDERQYCAPGVDLPVCGISRTLYGQFPEYHTSEDDLSLISPNGLQGGFDVIHKMLFALENNRRYRGKTLCEPQLGKRGLYHSQSYKGLETNYTTLSDFLAYVDGTNDLIDISNIVNIPVGTLAAAAEKLLEFDLIEEVE